MNDEINKGGFAIEEEIPHDTPIGALMNPKPYQCDKCDFRGTSPASLRMHRIRKHSGRNWDTSKNFQSVNRRSAWSKKAPRSVRLANRREYQKRLRARYYAEGKNAPAMRV